MIILCYYFNSSLKRKFYLIAVKKNHLKFNIESTLYLLFSPITSYKKQKTLDSILKFYLT